MTDDTIVPFKPKEVTPQVTDDQMRVFVCRCGCLSWEVRSDNTIACSNCQNVVLDAQTCGAEWRVNLPEVDPTNEKGDVGTTHCKVFNSAGLARRRVLTRVKEWEDNDKLEFVYGLAKDGETSAWSGAEDTEQRDKIMRRIMQLLKYMEETDFDT